MHLMSHIFCIFLSQLLGMTLSGSCVTAPPLMAGMLLPFTACVMEREILLQSYKAISTSLEDTQMLHGVNDSASSLSAFLVNLSVSVSIRLSL